VAQNSLTTEFLFDFIYLDRPRVASYFAQLFDDGVLTQTKKISQQSETDSNRLKAGLAGTGVESCETGTLTKSMERQYDTAWSIPINVINRLDELNFIYRDIKATPIGQIALVKGKLRLVDIRMLKDMWKTIMQLALHQNSAKNKAATKNRKENEAMADLLAKLPHALQMSLFFDGIEIWSTLNPEHMTVNPDDLAFKHGANVAGEWMILGVIDAHPDDEISDDMPSSSRDLENGMFQVLNAIREFFGRSQSAYGATPIAIFRSVKKRSHIA
jgi:hypothetical protein